MKIRKNITYPYPIWGWRDDFTAEDPEFEIDSKSLMTNTDFVYKLTVKSHNADIDKLIAEGKAVYACVVECSPTFYHQIKTSALPEMIVSIPRTEVFKEVEFKWMILSTEAIPSFESETLNEIYGGFATYPKGAMLAYITSFSVYPELSEEPRSLDDIFAIVKSSGERITFDFDRPKIRIALPKEDLRTFDRYSSRCASTMHSTIVLEALVKALSQLSEADDELDWVKVLKISIDELDSDDLDIDDEEDLEEYRFTLDQCFDIAHSILDQPYRRMFEDIKIDFDNREKDTVK